MFLTDLADKLRAYRPPGGGAGLTVVEVAGWKTRTFAGGGMTGNVGHLWHHTATNRKAYAYSDIPTLNILINGHSSLPGPLCNIALGRSGTVYVIAAGQANHAGAGSIGGGYRNVGNYVLIGNEMESSGVAPSDWTDAQLRVMPHLGAALDRAYSGGGQYFQIGHREYSSQGKIDPSFIDMNRLRDQINGILNQKNTTPAAAASGTDTAPSGGGKEWSEMATKDEVKAAFREVLNEPIKRQGGRTGNTSIIAMIAWLDARLDGLGKKLDPLEKAAKQVGIIWGAMFQGFSYSGKPGTTERPLFRRLDALQEKNGLEKG